MEATEQPSVWEKLKEVDRRLSIVARVIKCAHYSCHEKGFDLKKALSHRAQRLFVAALEDLNVEEK